MTSSKNHILITGYKTRENLWPEKHFSGMWSCREYRIQTLENEELPLIDLDDWHL